MFTKTKNNAINSEQHCLVGVFSTSLFSGQYLLVSGESPVQILSPVSLLLNFTCNNLSKDSSYCRKGIMTLISILFGLGLNEINYPNNFRKPDLILSFQPVHQHSF